ncbi:MAG: glycosyltransferase [Paracoccaceae bacterium]
MILIEAGHDGLEAFEAKLLFAGALAAAGHRPLIDDRTLPPDLAPDLRYEAAPYLCDPEGVRPQTLILIGGESVDGLRVTAIRGLASGLRKVALIGRFAGWQDRQLALARIAHAAGREPLVADLSELLPRPWPCQTATPLFAPAYPSGLIPDPSRRRLLLLLESEQVEDPAQRSGLLALAQSPKLALRVILPASARSQAENLSALGLPSYRDTELSPAALAASVDLVAFAAGAPASQRAAAIGVAALLRGAVLLDLTPDAALGAAGAPALRAPPDLFALGAFIEGSVIPDLSRLARATAESPWATAADLDRLERAIGLTRPTAPQPEALPPDPPPDAKLWFLPTNGIGLGHARRALHLAAAVPDPGRVAFFAHGSCATLLSGSGRPVAGLVARTGDQLERLSADILNFLRLRRHLRQGDLIVFDGGFVYDAVLRALGETGARGIWVRRGLWQPGQATQRLLEREKAFPRVIVPGEAFDELDRPVSWGPKIATVGPIVNPLPALGEGRRVLRDRLAALTGRPFTHLVVTMLGAGVAADRSPQLVYLAHLIARRPDILHVMLAWPGSVVPRGLYGWANSRVVHTTRAPELTAAADTLISAAGYNSFHEALYNRVPTIFVPQMAPYMDDQEARAKAAAKRGLAAAVKAEDLMQLGRTLDEFLEGRAEEVRAVLAKADLPAPGTAAAAAIIAKEAGA